MERAADILRTTQDPAGWLALTGDKQLLFSEQNDAFLMYAIYRGRWVAFGDPIGNPERFATLGAQFCDLAARANARPVLYGVSDAYLPIWTDLGFGMNRIGDEAIVRLPARSGGGHSATGLTFDILCPPHDRKRRPRPIVFFAFAVSRRVEADGCRELVRDYETRSL